jgi:hypothetical protein
MKESVMKNTSNEVIKATVKFNYDANRGHGYLTGRSQKFTGDFYYNLSGYVKRRFRDSETPAMIAEACPTALLTRGRPVEILEWEKDEENRLRAVVWCLPSEDERVTHSHLIIEVQETTHVGEPVADADKKMYRVETTRTISERLVFHGDLGNAVSAYRRAVARVGEDRVIFVKVPYNRDITDANTMAVELECDELESEDNPIQAVEESAGEQQSEAYDLTLVQTEEELVA